MQVLDTTLRDGSYAINFQFTANDTAIIAAALENAGVRWIEVGHGVGLNASSRGHGQAVETDEAYLEATAGALTSAKWGMFCIPGIAELEHVDMAAEYGMSFIRIGTNVAEVDQSEPFVRRAKEHGMYVSANFMKSYTMPPREFAQMAKLTQNYGSDVLCVVDSAGGMMRTEVEAYFRAVRDACDMPMAFHGHNNLGLAVSHSLLAAELGAVAIDGSLQGMGRSAGNAPTEMLVASLHRMGYETGIDMLELLDVGAKYVRPLIRRQGHNMLDTVCGFSQFHSSFMGVIRQFSSAYRVDPRRLIIALCEHDRVNAPEPLVEELASQLAGEQDEVFSGRFDLSSYFGHEQD